ncbi:hypothetical protein, partial [Aneurinibacillus tyrosinisolvens]|uniref:hypothetical protein n=1 Tax=Aneurinibacillus tyrosinisolvens TaxID=1443435 RepID=UPI001F469ACD
ENNIFSGKKGIHMDKQKRGLKRCRRMIMMDITSGNAHNHKIKKCGPPTAIRTFYTLCEAKC